MNCAIIIRRVKDSFTGQSVRKAVSIEEIKNPTTFKTVFSWNPRSDNFESFIADSFLIEKISQITGQTLEEVLEEFDVRTRILKWMQENDIRGYKEVGEIVGKYYREPKQLMQKIENGV